MTTKLETSQEKQKVKSTHGGKRKGAGRKPMYGGEEPSRKMKRKFNEYVTEEEIELIVANSVQKASDGDMGMARFLIEQWFGKATQRIAGDDTEDPLKLIHILKHGSEDRASS